MKFTTLFFSLIMMMTSVQAQDSGPLPTDFKHFTEVTRQYEALVSNTAMNTVPVYFDIALMKKMLDEMSSKGAKEVYFHIGAEKNTSEIGGYDPVVIITTEQFESAEVSFYNKSHPKHPMHKHGRP